MGERGSAVHGLTTAQLEQRLATGGLPAAEARELSAELSRRLADELWEGMPGSRPPTPDRADPVPQAPVGPPPPDDRARAGRSPGPVPLPRPPSDADPAGHPSRHRDGGFARFAGGVIALLVITGGALAVVGALSEHGSRDYTPDYSTSPSYTPSSTVDDTPASRTSPATRSTTRTPSERTPSAQTRSARIPATGISGTFTVSWRPDGQASCVAKVGVVGAAGQADVTCRFDTGETFQVRQALALASNGGSLGYVGSDPQDLNTGALLRAGVDYFPDIFVLGRDTAGDVVFVQVCDSRGPQTCVPAG